MSITIELPALMEQKLREWAAAHGTDVRTVVAQAVAEKLQHEAPAAFSEILAPVHEEFARSGMTDEELERFLADELAAARAERRPRTE